MLRPVLDLRDEAREFGQLVLTRCQFPEAPAAVTCGVSGGADSLALLILARLGGLEVEAVHVDHGLRPDGEAEAQFVARVAKQVGARFRSERAAVGEGPDLEARARKARLALLGSGAMTGHTADDQAETLLINLLRGAGVAGLAGMRPGGTHPLLGIRRHDTARLCLLAGLSPVDDPSNRNPRFVRNRVRHELLPLMDDISQRDVVPLLNRTAGRARSLQGAVEILAGDLDPTDTRELQSTPIALAAEALRRWLRDAKGHPPSEAELIRVMEVVEHKTKGCELSGGRRVARSNGVLRLQHRE